MPSTLVEEEILVEAISSKFGGAIKSRNEWLNFNKGVTTPLADLVKGQTYKMQLSITDKGKRYVNQILDGPTGSMPDNGKSVAKASFVPKAKFVDTSKGQMLGGLFHDVATVVASLKNKSVSDAVKAFEEVAEEVVRIRKKYD